MKKTVNELGSVSLKVNFDYHFAETVGAKFGMRVGEYLKEMNS